MSKPWLMREPIPKEGRTLTEKVEYWLFKRGISSNKGFCKWHRTHVQETIDSIPLDVSDIKFVPNNEHEL